MEVDPSQKSPARIDGSAIKRTGVFRFQLADAQRSVGGDLPAAGVGVVANVERPHFPPPEDERRGDAVDAAVDRQRSAGLAKDLRRRLDAPSGRNENGQHRQSRGLADGVLHFTDVAAGIGQGDVLDLLDGSATREQNKQK